MQVLSSSKKKDITPSQLAPDSVYDFVFAKSGEAVIKTGNTDFILSGNQMLLMSSFYGHTLSVTNAPFEFYSFSVDYEEVKNILGTSRLSSLFLKRMKNSYHIFDFSENYEKAETLVARIEEEYNKTHGTGNEITNVLIKLLVLEMFKVNPSPFLNSQHQNKSMQKIQEYIDLHFDEDITVENLAKSAFLTVPYLSHSFKSFYGYSPKQYLTLIRLINAKKLLLTTNLSINEICRKIGYSDINNFIRTFKSFYGTTPKKFRSN